jgi:hypothetical protein
VQDLQHALQEWHKAPTAFIRQGVAGSLNRTDHSPIALRNAPTEARMCSLDCVIQLLVSVKLMSNMDN